jgi:ribonuclease G
MSKEIIINSDQKQTRIAIVENGKLAELFIETKEVERTIGNLFLGRVRRIMPSIQAAFIDIGQKQDAFLHFSDLVDNIPDWLKFIQQENPKISSFKAAGKEKENSDYDVERIEPAKSSGGSGRNNGSRGSSNGGEINPVNYLKRDAPILVRISKEPIQSKGSRITTDISLAGRFLVLVPLAGYVAVSKKIASYKERRRLKALAKSLVPEGFGVIVRTVAEGRNAKALDTDLRLLIEKWEKVEERLAERPEIPCEIHEDVNMASSIIRDFFSEDFDRIVIDNDRLFRNIKGYVQAVAPKMASKVQMHKGARSLFEAMKIEKAVEQAFSNRVDLPSGGYLFIEQTEAMHVIDVNSGRAGRGLSQEENSTRVNLESATLIAEQVRLRDLGGIIVVDFIDMRQPKNRRKVYDHLRREFRKDRAVTKVLQMSDFGLIQITRQRLRPSITHTFAIDGQSAGSATGGGVPLHIERASYETVEPDDLVGKIDDWLAGFREAGRKGPVKLIVHPFTASYLNRRIPGQSFRWYMKYRIRVRIDADEHIDPLSFRFVDCAGKTASQPVWRKDLSPRYCRQLRISTFGRCAQIEDGQQFSKLGRITGFQDHR